MLKPPPRGRPPKNKLWNTEYGCWINKDETIKDSIESNIIVVNNDEIKDIKNNFNLLKSKKKITFISWNVAGLRAIIKKNVYENLTFELYIRSLNPDFICLNETKLTKDEDIEKIDKTLLLDYSYRFWNKCKIKNGYSSTAILTNYKPLKVNYGLNIADVDENKNHLIFNEGRIIT